MKQLLAWIVIGMVPVSVAPVWAQGQGQQRSAPPANASAPVAAGDLTGNWQGTLAVGNGLRTLIKVSKGADGKYKAVFYSIDQGGQPLGINKFDVQGSAMTFSITGINLT